MNILHTAPNYYPRIGGVENVVKQLSEKLVKKGHTVTVATTYTKERTKKLLNKVETREFKIFGNQVKGIKGNSKDYIKFLLHNNWDIMLNYAAQNWTTDLTLRVLDDLKCIKILAPCGYSGLIGFRKYFYKEYFKFLPKYLEKYDGIIYHSENYIDKEFGDRYNIRNYKIIPNGIEINEFEKNDFDFRKEYNIKTRYLILTVGNHYWVKGHYRLIKAFKKLNRPDTTLVIIGNPLESFIKNVFKSCWFQCEISAKRNDNIILLDNIPRKDVISAFKAADIFIFGSYIEAFPLVILEAMIGKTPFVSFEVGALRKGSKEFPSGIIVKDIDEMAVNINKLIEHKDLCIRLKELGYRIAKEKYNWDVIADKYESYYEELLNKKGRK